MRPALCLFFGFRRLVCGFPDFLNNLMEDVWILSTAEYFRFRTGFNLQLNLVFRLAGCVISQIDKSKHVIVSGSAVILQHGIRDNYICHSVLGDTDTV